MSWITALRRMLREFTQFSTGLPSVQISFHRTTLDAPKLLSRAALRSGGSLKLRFYTSEKHPSGRKMTVENGTRFGRESRNIAGRSTDLGRIISGVKTYAGCQIGTHSSSRGRLSQSRLRLSEASSLSSRVCTRSDHLAIAMTGTGH